LLAADPLDHLAVDVALRLENGGARPVDLPE
jgi:hypothetical protein